MIGLKWLRKIRVTSAIKAECEERYGLRSTTWKTRSDRTPPYASCYNIPKDWLEGVAAGRVVTFWGAWGEKFTGEVMVGPFDAWWNRTVVWSEGKVVRHADTGDPGGRMAPQRELEALLEAHPAFERLGVSFKGLSLKFAGAGAPLLHQSIALAVRVTDRLLAREEPPLLKAAKAGGRDAVRSLLDAGADPDEFGPELREYARSASGRYRFHDRPLLAAVMNDDAPMVSLLMERGADTTVNPNYILWIALENGKNHALRALFQGGFRPSPWGLPYGDLHPLPFAASKGDPEAVRILLEVGLAPGQNGPRLLDDARAQASGPRKEEIRRLLEEAGRKEEAAAGRLSLAPATGGAELSRTEED